MRFVVLGSLLGSSIAIVGLAFFGMGWLMALAVWFVGGPAGAILAVASTLTLRQGPSAAPVATAFPTRAT
ncbi:MAG TPA: hypothetical protein VM899_02820 [Rubellimicrobium sp.]|jgi:hypothetical protein|nr:hypothetical protein [Rubellimicrobium sp.]